MVVCHVGGVVAGLVDDHPVKVLHCRVVLIPLGYTGPVVVLVSVVVKQVDCALPGIFLLII